MIVPPSPSSQDKPRPRVADGIRIYAIGDIHGRADLLGQLLKRIDADVAARPISQSIEVYLGDYIDRGPGSRKVLDHLVARSRTHRGVFLKGNHEDLLTEFLVQPSILEDWQQLGGLETLKSYGIKSPKDADATVQTRLAAAFEQALPDSHRQFLDHLKLSFSCGDYFFVHAGIRPGIPLTEQREDDLLWIRAEFLLCEDDFEKIIVHGHSPVAQPDIRSNRINIDTGAYATGRLTCLALEHDVRSFV